MERFYSVNDKKLPEVYYDGINDIPHSSKKAEDKIQILSPSSTSNYNRPSLSRCPSRHNIILILLSFICLFLFCSVIYQFNEISILKQSRNPQFSGIQSFARNDNRTIDRIFILEEEVKSIQFVVDQFHDNKYNASNGREYSLTLTVMNYTTAKRYCKSQGGDLATTGMRDEVVRKEIVEKFLHFQSKGNVWVGIENGKNGFQYIDNEPADASNTDWDSNEPQPYYFHYSTDCAVMVIRRNFKIQTTFCSYADYALCEK